MGNGAAARETAGAVEHEGTGYQMVALRTASPEGAVRHVALPYYLPDLHRAVGHTIHLCALRDPKVASVEKLSTSRARAFATEAGMAPPAHCTSAGKALLAYTCKLSSYPTGFPIAPQAP
ncbi:IclR family transcriptional regulator domain-containing protein [Streptomyces niveiscabiei]|uniref:IclR-ED domain-containing protein n=1 Tax=Streptomyces niveiscabiei TaxID=164115 RepID=A0ABW9I442_9ACTN